MRKFLIGLILVASLATGVSAQTVNRACPAKVRCEVNNLTVRSGPGTNYKNVGTCNKGQILTCLGKLGEWYVVQLPNDCVGLVSDVYCEPSYSK